MRSIADVLRDLTGGQTYDELNGALAEVVGAVVKTRRAGQITLTLKVKANGESSVMITDEIKTKVPQDTRGETLFFTTANGDLLRDDPRQQKLPLRAVPGATLPQGDGGSAFAPPLAEQKQQ